IVSLDGEKSASADMERHPLQDHPALYKSPKQRLGKMQTGGRGRDGPLLAGKERLVIGPILLVRLAAGRDIGRQRHLAPLGKGLLHKPAPKRKRTRYPAPLT